VFEIKKDYLPMFDIKNINRARGPKEGSLMNRKMVNYIVKGKEVFVGLEDSKKTWKVCVRSEGREIHYTSMQARYSILHEYLHGKFPECATTVIYEAGFKGFGLHDQLTIDGIECVVTPPTMVTQQKCNRVKTDKIDARRLATVLEKGDFKGCDVPDPELREDRQLSRALVQVQGEITRQKNRIRKFFDFHGYAEVFPAGAWSEKQYKEARTHCVSEPLRFVLDCYFAALDSLREIRKKLHRKIMELSRKERYAESVRIISSIAGVGKLTAIRLVLEWGNKIPERFKSGKSLACFAGLTQSEYSTGEKVRRGRITGVGRGYIRASLIQCAWMNIKRDAAMLEAFNRIAKNTGSKKKAIVAIARKLVVRIWTCLHFKVEYVVGVIE
jgi:transposase